VGVRTLEQSMRPFEINDSIPFNGPFHSLTPIPRCPTIIYMNYEVCIPQGFNSTTFNLKIYGICIPVISAAELPLTKRNYPPHAFVSARVPGSKYKTKAVKGSRDPHWDEAIRL
jgi:hypothetical protein